MRKVRRTRKWINNCNVVISGVSSGIGRDLARLLVTKYGCKVFGIARSVPKLDALKAELGDKFDFISADVSSADAWNVIAVRLAGQDFCPDILINNAGIIHPFVKFCSMDFEEAKRVLDTNFYSVLYAVRALKPLLDKSPRRAIVNVASASAYLSVAGQAIYSASKSAVLAFSEALKQELDGEGYYVGAVMPGPVKTDLYEVRGSATHEKKVKDDTVANVGITSKKCARRIVNAMRRRKFRISTDLVAKMMSLGYRVMPTAILKLISWGSRKVRLATFRDIYKDEI